MRFRILPIFLIAIGLGFLLGNLGVIPSAEVREFFRIWWPAFLIAFGIAALLRPPHHRHRRHQLDGGDRPCRPSDSKVATSAERA